MDNGDSLLDVIDGTSDLFGGQNDGHSSLFNWADEFLGDEMETVSSTVAMESGNLATNVNQPNHLLSTQNYAVTSSIPTQNVAIATSQFLSSPATILPQQQQTSTMLPTQTLVTASPSTGLTTQILQQNNGGNQQFILRTSSGNQIQLNRQALQFQQQILQQQQQQQQAHVATAPPFHQILTQQSTVASPSSSTMNRSVTPNADGLSYSGAAVTHTVSQLRASPSPNVNLVHLPPNLQQQQQQQLPQQQTHQFQIAPGTILQIPAGASGNSQNLVSTTLLQGGQQALLGNSQQGTLVNAQNTVIQNPNVVNVNVAAQHVLCNNPSQQPRTNIGLTNIQTASPSPFNIQGTLIQTAEGKSILIPSQNLAQPINLQGLSVATPAAQSQPISIQGLSVAQPVATPVAQPQIQQPAAQNTVANMLQLAQQQQQTGLNVDNRTAGTSGVQQIVLNHQGQQILVQRAQPSTGQPQNFIVRTAGGQPGIVQLQQRTAPQQVTTQLQGTTGQSNAQPGIVQLQQRSGQTTIQSAQQTLQALAAGSGNQQIKFVNQGATTQQSVPVFSIGGQNVTLQQISNQLNNLQGLKIQQQQQQQQQTIHQQHSVQQQSVQSQPDDSLTFQGHDQNQLNTGQLTLNQGQTSVNQLLQNQLFSQPNINSSQVPVLQTTADSSADSVENQTRLILQKIHNSLKKSQADALNSAAATVSNIQALQNKSIGNIKQEPQSSVTFTSSASNTFYPPVSVKTESNLIETLIKQEKGVNLPCASGSASSIQSLFTCTAQNTNTSSTLSQASTPMSIYLLSNSQNVQSTSSLTSVKSMGNTNLLMSASDSSGGSLHGKTLTNNSFNSLTPSNQVGSVQSVVQPGQISSIVQTGQSGSVGLTGSMGQAGQTGSVEQTGGAMLQIGQTGPTIPAGQVGTGTATLQTIHLPPELQQQLQRVQLEIRKVQSSTTLTAQQKRDKLQQLQIFQKRILLKGRVLATTKADQSQIKPGIDTPEQPQPTQSLSSTVQSNADSSSQPSGTGYMNVNQSNSGLKNLLRQDESTQEQPNSTSNLGQAPQSSNSLMKILGSGTATTTTVSQPSLSSSSHTGVSQNVAMVSQNVAMVTQSVPVSTSSSTESTAQQVAVPTQIKIADKVLTLNLTPAQKDKVQSYLDRMTPEQQQQYLQTQQHVLHRIQKQQALKAQIHAQAEAQKKRSEMAALSQTPNQTTTQQTSQNSQMPTSDILNVTPEVKVIPVPNTRVSTQLTTTTPTTVIRGQKRSYMDIPKGTLINQQIRQDQNHASNPDTKRPFKSRGDACRRLLRYHVFQSYGPSPEEFNKFDSYMEDISEELLRKKDRMFDKFRHLLVHETLRVHPSSELVMLQRMQNQDLRKTLEEERLQVKQDPESFEPMPMKFLCKKERTAESTSSELDTVDIKQEPNDDVNSEASCYDSSESVKAEIKEEPMESEENVSESESRAAKMRKLVIKTDGMNFRSSFKRVSLDSSRSSVDDFSQDPSMNSDVSVSMDIDDDDTNDYSNDKFDSTHDEDDDDERAVLTISPTEDSQSQNTQMDSNLDVFLIDNSLSQNSTDNSEQFFKGRRNFEVSKDIGLSTDTESVRNVKKSHDFSGFSRHTSIEEKRSFIPKNASDKSIASSMNETEDSDLEEKYSGFQPMRDNLTDKFGMYQPITESLTDSEENSYYSADNAADQQSVVNDDDLQDQGHWNKTKKSLLDSDDESDSEVKAQMESAINSILSLSQGATNEPDSVYNLNSQSTNQFFNHDSQSNSLYSDSSSLQAELDFQTDLSQGSSTSKVKAESSKSLTEDFSTDLDAAVNSILM